MSVLRRAVLAYYRANVNAWAALHRWLRLPVIDPWVAVAFAQLAAVVALVGSGHTSAAMIVSAAGIWLVVLRSAVDR